MPKKQRPAQEAVSAQGQAAAPALAKKPREKPARKTAIRDNSSTDSIAQLAEAVSAPAPEEVARLAYSYWEARGCQGGSPEGDWLRAEQELRSGTDTQPVSTGTSAEPPARGPEPVNR